MSIGKFEAPNKSLKKDAAKLPPHLLAQALGGKMTNLTTCVSRRVTPAN
jgi:hypothetical protein